MPNHAPSFAARYRDVRRRFGVALAATAVVAGAVVTGCSSGSDGSTTTTTEATVTTSADDGGEVVTEPGPVTVGVGEQVTLELRSNPTTGYSWELTAAPDTSVVRVVSDEYVPPAEQIPGAGGSQRIVVEGVSPGTATLDFGYLRPWESGTPPAETASFQFTVT